VVLPHGSDSLSHNGTLMAPTLARLSGTLGDWVMVKFLCRCGAVIHTSGDIPHPSELLMIS
jgi:hypothetical protein